MKVKNEMTKQRQPHADFIIMQANDMSLRFDVQYLDNWYLVTTVPCQFSPDCKYRLHQRDFPTTSLSEDELERIGGEAIMGDADEFYGFRQVANAAIKQYILDTEKESK